MSSSEESRVVWTCPECSRNFRLPKSKPRPKLCARCGRKAKLSNDAGTASADGEEVYFQEAEPVRTSSLKFGVVAQPVGTAQDVPPEPTSTAPDVGSTSIDELSERMDEMLEHLESITRTMKLVRWVMWGLGFATILSVVITGVGLLYSISMIGSLGDLLNQPDAGLEFDELPIAAGQEGDRHDVKIPPQLRENMKQIEQYSEQLNELLNEANQ